jgi:FkbM family methyltransferase
VLWAGVSGGTGWDVGANCGQHIPLMRRLFGRVVSFEPCTESYEAAAAAYPGAELLAIAVSDHDGQVSLVMAEGEHADTGMLISPGTHGVDSVIPSGAQAVRTVLCRSADSLAGDLGTPDFIKVDTEGHELAVLRGALGLLRQRLAGWLIEFHSQDLHACCTQLLNSSGYAVETIRHPRYGPGTDMWYRHGWLRARPDA